MKGSEIRRDKIFFDGETKLARVRHIYDKDTWIVLLFPILKSDSAIQDNVLAVTNFRCRQGHKQRVGLILRPLYIPRPPDLRNEHVVIQ